MLRFTTCSFAQPAVAADRRAELALLGSALEEAHHRLGSSGHEAFILSTCLRVEIAVAADQDTAKDLLGYLYRDPATSELAAIRTDEAAFVHLCRIAAGLDSPLIGEPEVFAQFRQAVEAFQRASSADGSLARVLEAAVGIARSTRRSLVEPASGSLASVAAEVAAPLGRVAILGSGAMARAAVDSLDGADVAIFSRRPARVGSHQTRPWMAAAEALGTYPAVISTVPGKAPLFESGVISAVLARRRHPLLLVDLGMPPGFDQGDLAGPVRYLGIDDVASSTDAHPSAEAEDRAAALARAMWRRIAASDRARTVIAGLVAQAEQAVTEEVKRYLNRLSATDDPERVLRQLAHTVARRVLHPPISYLGSSGRSAEADVLAEAFGIDDD